MIKSIKLEPTLHLYSTFYIGTCTKGSLTRISALRHDPHEMTGLNALLCTDVRAIVYGFYQRSLRGNCDLLLLVLELL